MIVTPWGDQASNLPPADTMSPDCATQARGKAFAGQDQIATYCFAPSICLACLKYHRDAFYNDIPTQPTAHTGA